MSSPAGNRVNVLVLSFTLISGVVVFFRLFTRTVLIRNWGFEDVCISFAMIFSIGLTVTIAEQVQNGMGRHINTLTPKEMVDSQKAFWASIWMYYMALTLTKMSLLVQYLKIFPTRRFRIVCSVVLGLVVAWGIWAFFGSIFLCTPVQFFWDKTIRGKCLNQFAVWFTNGGMNIAQDFAILILPMPVLRTLSIPARQKKALMVLFALGGFVCVISIVRLQSLVAISNSKDPTFDNPPAATFSAVETNVGIITACLPSLRPLLSAMMPSYFPPTTTSRYTNVRTHDEEQPKYLGTPAASTRPPTASTSRKPGHSRSGSNATYSSRNESELEEMYNHQATVAGTGSRVNGPARQVHIRSASRESSLTRIAPRLPRLPEDMATIGPMDTNGSQARHSRSHSNPISGRNHVRTPRTPRTPVVQKPLPITPFPIIAP